MLKTKPSDLHLYKWGGIASFLLVVSFVFPSYIYLAGNLRNALGPLSYSIADLFYGPVWAASLVTTVLVLRERIGKSAPRRMDLALLASFAAACAFVAVACIRAANRHYHLIHPELHLESSSIVLTVWATQVAGVIGAAWHFLGWAWMLIGSASWTTGRFPRALSALYMSAGVISLIVFILPDIEGAAVVLGVIVSIWQGILLLKTEPLNLQPNEIISISPD